MKYDKNCNYSPKKVAEDLIPNFPELKFSSLHAKVSARFTKMGFHAANDQTQARVFHGTDCQAVYDYYIEKANSPKQMELRINEHARVSVEFASEIGDELAKRSKALGIPKIKICEDALADYFERVPFDELSTKSREELEQMIRDLQKAAS